MRSDQLQHAGQVIRDARLHRGWTQMRLAEVLGTSQSAVNRMESGRHNFSIEMLARIGQALDSELVTIGIPKSTHLRVTGGTRLSGTIEVRSSKNAAVALLCASLLNKGKTTLRGIARIEEVNRIVEVLNSIGVATRWLSNGRDLEILPPAKLDLSGMDNEAARRTRSVIMLFAPLLHQVDQFELPFTGGCDLGNRTIEPHLTALRPFGLDVSTTHGNYHATVNHSMRPTRPIVLTERGDTVTENALMAGALSDGVTIIRNASSNYMVQDLCVFLQKLGVQVDGIGTTNLTVHGVPNIKTDVEYAPSEDPVEAMSLISAAIVTNSELTITRAPIEFLEIELAILEGMGLNYERSAEYCAENGHTRLVDLTIRPSVLKAPLDKIHPMPSPGLNIDNLPFFALIAAAADGSTLIHDWVYDNRAIYLTELSRLGASVRLLDPHRVYIEGPTRWSGAEVMCPPALRPAVVLLLAMLAAKGDSILRNVYVINRGYEDLAARLNEIGAEIETFSDR